MEQKEHLRDALLLHGSVTLSALERSIGGMNKKVDRLHNIMEAMFAQFCSPEERELVTLIDRKGGIEAVRGDDDALTDAVRWARRRSEQAMRPGLGDDSALTLSQLKAELSRNLEDTIAENRKAFEGKWGLQIKKIKELKNHVTHEGDRIIAAIREGPHDRIIDPVRSSPKVFHSFIYIS
jgi:hypothetical protein